MEKWEDTGIILSLRPHAEHAAIVSALTLEHGKHHGYVHGARSSQMRGKLELGNHVDIQWQSRLSENLGQYKIDLMQSYVGDLLNDRHKLTALQAACALTDLCIAEREAHPNLYHGFLAFLDALKTEVWQAAYVYWEIGLLQELGFGLNLKQCVATGATDNLIYVSPKSGAAVCAEAGEPYKDRMLALPDFLSGGGNFEDKDIAHAMKMTGYFLLNRVLAPANLSMPEPRTRLFQSVIPDQETDLE